MIKTVEGNLLTLAKEGNFDVIVHGCNCQHAMFSGIAAQIAKDFPEAKIADDKTIKGDFNKLGTIDSILCKRNIDGPVDETFTIVNAYTQFNGGANLDYCALLLCLRKVAHIHKGEKIGIPQIGCHVAGGDWNVVSKMIQDELGEEDVTVVIYKP